MNSWLSREFPGISTKSRKPQNSWKTLAWPMFSNVCHGNSWKKLARPMFSMNSWLSREFPGISTKSRKPQNSWKTSAWSMFSMNFHEKMANIGLANVFHEFVVFQRISWDQQESIRFNEFMENIGLVNVFHGFFMEIHGKHGPGQCFP